MAKPLAKHAKLMARRWLVSLSLNLKELDGILLAPNSLLFAKEHINVIVS
jgi:hypothetical protein